MSFEEDAAETDSIGFVKISAATSMLHDIRDGKRCVCALVVPGGAHNELDYCLKEEDLVYLKEKSRLIGADIVTEGAGKWLWRGYQVGTLSREIIGKVVRLFFGEGPR